MKMEGWRILDTGLKVSLSRSIGPVTFKLKAEAASSLIKLIGQSEPFKEIQGDPFEPMPSSQPNRMDQAAQDALR
jgi:hypothetical protein